MVFKVSCSLALLAYLVQSLMGLDIERNVLRSLIFFIVLYVLSHSAHLLYLHIKLRLLLIEKQKADAARAKKEEEKRKHADALSEFMKETNLN